MKVCILSDSHDHIPLLDAAAADARGRGAEAILHCGDVVAPSTLKCLNRHGLPVHVIHGNNTGDLYTLGKIIAQPGNLIEYHGMDAGVELAGKRIFLVHYPHYARAMAATGDWDLVCCGHSHKTKVSLIPNIKGGETLLLNPGTVGGVGTSPATYMLLDLESMAHEIIEIPKSIEQDAIRAQLEARDE
ncbi:MAG: YfcE family phosphodiesterase [Candidatus Sedimenticola endophacoides]|uniref:Phosphoesterase n=1 Tax=Candidatus Sedimenticola endophacoides TaxID=2548426 RepID=A0A657PMZ9_9GAMM|nr:MAG: YfcE family phosphodiesterase [Candidatus Sedimenticola endophacoides]OQX34015.1 MAG: YfcE family phosphodiesterase [Candidatus Sedimenticola endophacoides]OQX41841.1 MAG: YfcE family phosphodiesterase [Candidatus Sedimenticola endophacoides]OQX42524.1 MAG: YfcE family phosphodiesterase [Candidatus Sedimenticola endophacoides]OQX44568.1 MAG: YfcE family phosphodiesterase [Candidatus Sedimenticola endophacoides]